MSKATWVHDFQSKAFGCTIDARNLFRFHRLCVRTKILIKTLTHAACTLITFLREVNSVQEYKNMVLLSQ